MVPEDDDLISNVHITPLRASRALALRFLANKFNLDMERITVNMQLQAAYGPDLLSRCVMYGICISVDCATHHGKCCCRIRLQAASVMLSCVKSHLN